MEYKHIVAVDMDKTCVFRFRRNVKYIMKLRDMSFSQLTKKYTEILKIPYNDSVRKKLSRTVYCYTDSRKNITLEEAVIFSKILRCSPALLAFGTLASINILKPKSTTDHKDNHHAKCHPLDK